MINEYTFNIAECCLWLAISVVLLLKSFRDVYEVRATLRVLSVTFFLFGVSDYIEAHTGAWWKPWWLLVLKGCCIAVFIVGFARVQKLTGGKT
jgi:hypothetical protein